MYPETLCGRIWCLTKWPISTRLVAVYLLAEQGIVKLMKNRS